ncbi:MAG: glycine betaine ABC transporter substrate-binding protein [Solirubrobacteraceae bacterium]
MMRLLRSASIPAASRPRVTVVSLLAALVCVACGASSSSSPTSSRAEPGATNTAQSSNSGTTGSTARTALPGTGKPQVTIGDKNYTEQFLLGELYTLALQAQGYTVALNQNIGPTAVTLQALGTGALDMYPEYLDVFNSSVAGYHRSFRSELAAYGAAQRYAGAHGLALLTATPFSDTPALGVTVGYAEGNHLKTLHDLVRMQSTMIVGGPPELQQISPGLPQLERAYGFTVKNFKDLAVGDQYTALNANTVQVADVNTTDGQLVSGNYALLADPENVFGWGNAVPVVSQKALAKEGPAFAVTIDRVNALLSTPVMRALNEAVDVAGQDAVTVARTFLETHGVIPPTS